MRHPYIRASQLEFRNRLASWRRASTQLSSWWWVFGAITTVALALLAIRPSATVVFNILRAHTTTMDALVALQASLLAHLGRRKWTTICARDWLSSLPVTRWAARGRVALRAIAPTLVLPLLTTAVVLCAALDKTLPAESAAPIVVGCLVATVVGDFLGWLLPLRGPGRAPRLIARTSPFRHGAATRLLPLSGWPLIQVRAWLPPRIFARLMVPAMLLLPMDVSANVAVAVLFLWAVAWYLCALLCALARITRDGAHWLRPTPVKFRRFAWAVTHGSLFKQVQWTLTATVLLIALGCRPVLAARFAEAWFAVVSITAALALTHARDSRPIRLKIAASICVLVALERVKQHLAALSAALASAWILRKAVRT